MLHQPKSDPSKIAGLCFLVWWWRAKLLAMWIGGEETQKPLLDVPLHNLLSQVGPIRTQLEKPFHVQAVKFADPK